MPQLVKGGKHVFGWTIVSSAGIRIPPEAEEEYKFKDGDPLTLIPGSVTSGGFALASPAALQQSPLWAVLRTQPQLVNFEIPEGDDIEINGKYYSWVKLRQSSVLVPPHTLERYGIRRRDRLLVVRGSGLGLGFAVRGPIVDEAGRHPEIEVFREE